MTVHSLEQALADSNAAALLARESGVAVAAVRRLLAALGNLPAEQVVRMCGAAAEQRATQERREGRYGR